MKGKKTILIGVVGLLISIVVLILIALLSQLPINNNGTDTPISVPVSTPNINVIDFNNSNGGAFEYAMIKQDDTIELRNKVNEKFIIGLQKKEWKSLQWSPDGKLISALGKSTDTIYDIYIYNTTRQEWNQVTDYKNFNTGVDQYTWVDNNTILFTHGEEPNRWLHRYNYISKETLKVSNIVGDMVSVSPDLKYLVIKSNDTAPEIYNAMGLQVQILNTIKNAETEGAIAFETVNFFSNSEKILALDIYGDYYKFNLGDSTAVKTTLTSDYTVTCSRTENSFNAYLITSNTVSYGIYSSRDDQFNILGEEAFKLSFAIDNDHSYCANGSVYLKLIFADGSTQWYKEDATQLTADAVLGENVETDIIRK